ncbi:GspH/FimT family pseudopilin [Robbsia sp. Bb-Pol-6]|uniref:Type II secretion system protein H n=1 Tax=Robbsia betulipollinis TaxID=2981849 RepID=A0ABT3ZRM3_9BURK|nr:GspH/FimT family pseudopilin [Robbsia betulipollinis]MCY0389186.1 GspH/FimT family pseudopilin [Robbsia betulipollinis]
MSAAPFPRVFPARVRAGSRRAGVRPVQARAPQRGFTLLEVLVVLVIGGLLVSLASLSFSRNPRTDLLEQAQRLALVFETAGDEAQLRAAPIAWQPIAGGYRFTVRGRDGWRPLADELLGPTRWREPINGVAIQHPGEGGTAQRSNTLVFGTESVGTPVVVTLFSDAGSISIASDGSGRFDVASGAAR